MDTTAKTLVGGNDDEELLTALDRLGVVENLWCDIVGLNESLGMSARDGDVTEKRTLVGGAVGPALSGTVSQSLGWRSVLRVSVALASCCELLLFTCFRETYKVSILRNKAKRLPNKAANSSIASEIAKGPGLDK